MPAWFESMSVPEVARRKLTDVVRETVNETLDLGSWHVLPIRSQVWLLYAGNIFSHVQRFSEIARNGPRKETFDGVRAWIAELIAERNQICSVTLALSPFEPFVENEARSMLGQLDWCLLDIARAIDAFDSALEPKAVTDHLAWLRKVEDEASSPGPIERLFGVPDDQACDQNGDFNASRVLSVYYRRYGELIRAVLPCLGALRLPQIADLLVALSAVGWILDCEDPVSAYCSMNSFMRALECGRSNGVERLAVQFLDKNEASLRQSRLRISRARSRIDTKDRGDEENYLIIAEIYKRLIEGPFRRYGWALHCMKVGNWTDPPMLTQLRDALIAQGGWLGNIASRAVIRNLRNGEAHESLAWDGIRERFVAEGVEIEVREVAHAAILADSFAHGCQAALACWKTMDAEHKLAAPQPEDPGRLSPAQRAEAAFGTNGIRVKQARFNAKVASITCDTLNLANVNPCLQALLLSHGLLPGVEQFDVYVGAADKPVVSVSQAALARTKPVWDFASTHLTSMPFSVFLPANFDARRRVESAVVASRSVAWIAVDDFLDALDASPELWDTSSVKLFSTRLRLISLALRQCLGGIVPFGDQLRLRAVDECVSEVIELLGAMSAPLGWDEIGALEQVLKVRYWWNRWGPVERLPGISAYSDKPISFEDWPQLGEEPGDLRWRTM